MVLCTDPEDPGGRETLLEQQMQDQSRQDKRVQGPGAGSASLTPAMDTAQEERVARVRYSS